MNKKILLTAITVVTVLILVLVVFPRSKDETTTLTTTVLKGPFEILVYSTGQLESENSDNILVPEKMKDRQTRIYNLTITDLIEEGTYVDSGDYVATLDHQAVEEQLKTALDEQAKSLSEYNDSKIDSNLTLSNQRDMITNAELELEEKEIAVQENIYEAPSIQRKGEMDLDKARRKLEQTIKAYQLKKQQEENKVARAFINYKQVKERVDALEELLNSLVIYSHRSGIISYFKYPFGGSVQAGSRVSMYQPIIATFPNMKSLITKTFINEIDISLIKKGQETVIGIDAFPDKKLTGEVLSVANMGLLMPKSDAKVFEVKIKIHGSDPQLKPAMTTSNIIQTGYFEDVLYAPIESVFHNDSLSYVCKVAEKGKKQIVETAETNENYIIIKQGVEEGEELLLLEPEDSESYAFAGMEIYEQIQLRKQEQLAKQAEEDKKRELAKQNEEQQPKDGIPQGIIVSR